MNWALKILFMFAQREAARYHGHPKGKVLEFAKKAKDLAESWDKMDCRYRDEAFRAACYVIVTYMNSRKKQ